MAHSEVTFGLVHGAWHGAWCWDLLRPELETQGYRSVAMDMPIDNPDANFDDYADVVVESLKDETDVILVGHSRAGNVIPRAAGRLATHKLIFLCSSFEPYTIGRPTEEEKDIVPPRNDERFQAGIIPIGRGLTLFDKDMARELFFGDCSEQIQDWAIGQFRPQRRSDDEPLVEKWPDVPAEYVICEDDAIVNPEWSQYVANNWLGIEPVRFPGGHSPFFSNPKKLADLLVSLAK